MVQIRRVIIRKRTNGFYITIPIQYIQDAILEVDRPYIIEIKEVNQDEYTGNAAV
jgi:hypothetical protein